MRINVPVNAQVSGNWECDFLGHAWNVTKTVAVWIAGAAIIALFTTMGYCMSEFGSTAVLPWVTVLIIGGVVIGFGVGAIREQPTGMGKFGAVMLILLILSALVVGAVIFQKMMVAETPIANSAQTVLSVAPVLQPTQVVVPNPVQPKMERERKSRETPAQEEMIEPIEDPCDPGGEKASAWGRRE